MEYTQGTKDPHIYWQGAEVAPLSMCPEYYNSSKSRRWEQEMDSQVCAPTKTTHPHNGTHSSWENQRPGKWKMVAGNKWCNAYAFRGLPINTQSFHFFREPHTHLSLLSVSVFYTGNPGGHEPGVPSHHESAQLLQTSCMWWMSDRTRVSSWSSLTREVSNAIFTFI